MQAETQDSNPIPQPVGGIAGIPRYTPGKSRIDTVAKPIKLSSNESSLGPSAKAVAAYHQVADTLNRYGDATQQALREAIAAVYELEPDRIVCGNGSNELIDLLIRAYLAPGDELVLTENHFEMCPIHAHTQGAEVVLAVDNGFYADVDAILAAVSDRTKMIFLANPNNPTGTYVPAVDLQRLQRGIPEQVMLVIDGAYAEYVTAADYESGLTLVDRCENVAVTRSFSKIYGLPALRIGWVYCPSHCADVLNRIRSPFNASVPAMAAAAAAVEDVEYTKYVRGYNATWLQHLTTAFTEMGLRVIPSVTNFYLLQFDADQGTHAGEAAAFLEAKGIIPRPVAITQQHNVLRITVGLESENLAVVAALEAYMQQKK